MSSARANQQERWPALLWYDGSDAARRAIEESGAVLGGGPAVVVTVWESVGSPALRHPIPAVNQFGREFRETSKDVVDSLDAETAEWAWATAREGAELARGTLGRSPTAYSDGPPNGSRDGLAGSARHR